MQKLFVDLLETKKALNRGKWNSAKTDEEEIGDREEARSQGRFLEELSPQANLVVRPPNLLDNEDL